MASKYKDIHTSKKLGKLKIQVFKDLAVKFFVYEFLPNRGAIGIPPVRHSELASRNP
jgi:hypothetical protein